MMHRITGAALFLALLLPGVSAAGESEKKEAAEGEGIVNGNGINPLTHYEEVITKNPFSPKRYRKPRPPAPKPKPKPAPPREKVVKKVDNLTLTGAVYDNLSKTYQAMIEVKDGPSLFLSKGQGYKKIKVLAVRIDGVDITDDQGKKRTLSLGAVFHDGVATKTEWTGGPPPGGGSSSSKSPSKTKGPSKPDLSDEAKRKLIEKMKERRRKRKK